MRICEVLERWLMKWGKAQHIYRERLTLVEGILSLSQRGDNLLPGARASFIIRYATTLNVIHMSRPVLN